ncbi:MAG: radical SAM protein [Tissierellia bacterium]|nr:radical SAM protein [Tissierellia bacterium]
MYIPKSPFIVCFNITSQCNLNCSHCVSEAKQQGSSISIEKTISVINEANSMGVNMLVLGGGEPLLHNNFFGICEYILSTGMKLSFVTNGTLVSNYKNEFARIVKYKNSLYVGISLDGHTPELHGYFRPKETFWPAVEAIELLTYFGIKVYVLCVLNKSNINIIREYLEFLSKYNIFSVRIIPLMPKGRAKKYVNEMLSPHEIYSFIDNILDLSDTLKINVGLHYPWEFLFIPLEKRQPSPCEAGYLRLWINSSGDIFPCSYMEDIPIGNIYCDSISDVWNNSPMLKALRNPKLLKGTCCNCQYRDYCRGGCRGLAYFLEGDYLCSDPYCPIVVKNKNLQT